VMEYLPDFLIIGVQKAATSWLYYCLNEHPEIHLPAHKREVDFLGGEKFQKKGWEWWTSRFEGARASQIIGDVSVDYIYNDEAPKLVKEKVGEVKLIVSLRDPIERAISAYYWNLRKGKIPNRSLNEGFREVINTFKDSSQTKVDEDAASLYQNIIQRGFYDSQIERYLNYFNLEDFLFLSFQKIKSKPLEQLQNLYRFLEVQADFKPDSLYRKPKRNSYLQTLITLERLGKHSKFVGKFADILHNLASKIDIGNDRPKLHNDVRKGLSEIYKVHNANLLEILNAYLENDSIKKNQSTDWDEVIGSWE